MDYRDLNKACPTIIDILVDYTVFHALLSFVDGFSGYNKMLMDPEHMAKTAFTTPWGTFLLDSNAFWVEERLSYLAESSYYHSS